MHIIGHLIYLDNKKIDQKHAKIIFVQDSFTVHKGHIKWIVAQKEAHWHPFYILIFY